MQMSYYQSLHLPIEQYTALNRISLVKSITRWHHFHHILR